MSSGDSQLGGDPGFHPTRWSLVAEAKGSSPEGRAALGELCSAYWYPLYAYLRRRGDRDVDAQDLVQGFFERLLEKGWLDKADRDRGRLRAYLLTALKRYTIDEHNKQAAQKRGGDVQKLSLDFDDAERRYALEPSHALDAERLYEHRFAHTLLGRAMDRVARKHRQRSAQKAERFALLSPFLLGDGQGTHAEVAKRLDLSETAVKVAVHRLRQDLKVALRAEVAESLADPADVDAEIRALMQAL